MPFPADALRDFATAALGAAGLARRHCTPVAETFIEAELLGFSTHGLAMLPLFADQLADGRMARDGEVRVVRRGAGNALLDGALLPGPVVLREAVRVALELAEDVPVVSVAVRRSANTACLATYLPPVAERGLIAMLFVGNPANDAVAPPGAAAGVYGTDPVAACIPTSGDPVLFDFATSASSNRAVERARRAGVALPCEALVDAAGAPSADPAVLGSGGALAPMGGRWWGHKGYALALLDEALTGCLAGHGRHSAAREGTHPGSACFLQAISPAPFAGREAFLAEMDALVGALRAAPPARDSEGPRVPGDRAWQRRAEQLRDGITLHADTVDVMETMAARFAIECPSAAPASSPTSAGGS
jgi:L-lactate dehydrogenase